MTYLEAVVAIRPPVARRETQGTRSVMTQTSNRLFDELAKMVTDAAGAAQGLRQEVETVMRGQADRVLADMDVVRREEFEAVKAMAEKAREENERLEARIAALEARQSQA
jgi:BMFP domain-containing protein YqiC